MTRSSSGTATRSRLLNAIFLAIFVVELALRIGAYGRRPLDFFRSGWNVFDFVVIGFAFVPGVRESSTLLRIARLLRVVRVVRILPDLRILVTGVIRSLPPLGSMLLLTTLLLFVYGMVGWLLFGEEIPQDWGNIGRAMLSLFVLLTLEDFPRYMERGMEVHQWSWIYFVTFVLITVFIVINVLIGIVLTSMEEARELAAPQAASAGSGGRTRPDRPGPGPRTDRDPASSPRRAGAGARARHEISPLDVPGVAGVEERLQVALAGLGLRRSSCSAISSS